MAMYTIKPTIIFNTEEDIKNSKAIKNDVEILCTSQKFNYDIKPNNSGKFVIVFDKREERDFVLQKLSLKYAS